MRKKTPYHHISDAERCSMTAMGMAGCTESQIAQSLGRSRSTIHRERRRNVCRDGKYRRQKATWKAAARRKSASRRSHYTTKEWAVIDGLLTEKWSPEQIAMSVKSTHAITISHQSIYRHIHTNRRLGGLLFTHLRHSGKKRRKRYGSIEGRGKAKGKRSIEDRPASIGNRTTRYHWEADTVMGATGCKHCLVTLVERKSGYALIGKLSHRTAMGAARKIIDLLREFPVKVLSITTDNGTEFNAFKVIERSLGIKIFFAHPHSAWERGTNENTNGLIRQYAPKGVTMKRLTQRRCNAIAYALNTRPRKRHGYKTPLTTLMAA